jgi:hypothetical protein
MFEDVSVFCLSGSAVPVKVKMLGLLPISFISFPLLYTVFPKETPLSGFIQIISSSFEA